MSNEITVRASLAVRNGSLNYPSSQPTTFLSDQINPGGPTPGQILADLDGTVVDLSQLTEPGVCRLMNLDPINYVIYGVFDATAGTFTPVGEILPTESYVIRLYRELGARLGTGTGTAPIATGLHLYVKAVGAPCQVLVEAFQR
jgi:hypothetical protein